MTSPIATIREDAIVTADGAVHEVDTIIFGTGFHVSDALIHGIVHGRDGTTLRERFAGTPQAYLGTTVPGFPNMFLLLGPNTGLLTTSVVLMIEAQIEYVIGALAVLDAPHVAAIEVSEEAHDAYQRELAARMPGTVWLDGGCRSWYLDGNGTNLRALARRRLALPTPRPPLRTRHPRTRAGARLGITPCFRSRA